MIKYINTTESTETPKKLKYILEMSSNKVNYRIKDSQNNLSELTQTLQKQ